MTGWIKSNFIKYNINVETYNIFTVKKDVFMTHAELLYNKFLIT